MATAPVDARQAETPVLQLDPETILTGERIGLFWPDKAAALGKLMAQDGQNDPIKVRKSGPRAKQPWTLVAGLHRLEGAKMEGLRAIDAIEVFGDTEQLRAIEASENIHRRSFAPIERACFVRAIADAAEARMKGQHEGLTQQQIAIRARWEAERAKAAGVVRPDDLADAEADYTSANLASVYGWSDATAESLGLSRRAMFRDLALHRALVAPFPDLYRDLARHPIIGENASALREIAAVKDEFQRGKLIRTLISYPAATVAQAKELAGIAAPSSSAPATGATKYMNNALSNIERLSAGQQRDFIPALLKALKPSALDALVEQIAAFKAGEAE